MGLRVISINKSNIFMLMLLSTHLALLTVSRFILSQTFYGVAICSIILSKENYIAKDMF